MDVCDPWFYITETINRNKKIHTSYQFACSLGLKNSADNKAKQTCASGAHAINLTGCSPYLDITPLVIWKFLNQGKNSGVQMKTGCLCLLYFSALLWVDGEKTPVET